MNATAYPTLPRYASIDEYYADGLLGTGRKWSREIDFGVWWRQGNFPHPVYRVTMVPDTFEIYAICLGGTKNQRDVVEVLASGIDEETAEQVLDGWWDRCGEPYSLDWIRQRLAGFPVNRA